MTTQRYEAGSRHLLRQAEEELAAGDARQAAEKGWGAAALAVKAYCAQNRWKHDSHFRLRQAVRRIARITGDKEFSYLFRTADLLHVCFYEDFYNVDEVGEYLVDILIFLDKLAELPDILPDDDQPDP